MCVCLCVWSCFIEMHVKKRKQKKKKSVYIYTANAVFFLPPFFFFFRRVQQGRNAKHTLYMYIYIIYIYIRFKDAMRVAIRQKRNYNNTSSF